MTSDEFRIRKGDLDDLISEMRHDADIEAWETPEMALRHYADRLASYR